MDRALLLDEIGVAIAGRYVVEQVLGRGGMGAVYRVCDARSGKKLALKRGLARDASKAAKLQSLLEHEYYTLVQLAHPRIIEVYDYGFDGRGPYYTMELLDGVDLDHGGRLPWKQACALLYDVASSLAILHSRGLIHRDVSSRNVRCTADGHAKLLDFGAMTSAGAVREVVGTPPFMAPEVLQMQMLDARADLFSLGALGYYLLTGRHAYPARRVSELRELWRSALPPLSRLVPEAPQPLGSLITQLLALDRNARPQSAAEVMKRLCAVAELPREEHVEVRRAYLTSPVLIGRDKALIKVRKRMLSLIRGDGGALLIEGVAGSGRSRLLDATAVEGKLVGASVVRADTGDAGEPWGVARALGRQLLQMLPKETEAAARFSSDVLCHVLDGLAGEADGPITTITPERSLLIRELRDLFLALSRSHPLLVVVDDADRIDEPSAALIAALAHKAERHPLILALAVERDSQGASSAVLRLLRSFADLVQLEQLQAQETEALIRSVFGDVTHVGSVAGQIHGLSQGNPRAVMELAQHLVDRGLARYEAGSWSLPARLDDRDLPRTLTASLAARLETIGGDARELLDALCLSEADSITRASYPELLSHRDSKRVFRALDELIAARMLLAVADGYRFTQRGFVSVLQATMPAERRVAIHLRLAELLARQGGDGFRRVHHLLEGGHQQAAVELLCSIDLRSRLAPLSLLENAIASAEQQRFPARAIHQLRIALLIQAALVLAAESFRRHLPPVLAQLELDSGLARYRELGQLAPGERLEQALAQTQQRFLAQAEHERVHSVAEAIVELARLSGSLCTLALSIRDRSLLEALPALEPLLPLSPVLNVVAVVVRAGTQWMSGRLELATALYDEALARTEQPDRAGFDEGPHARALAGFHYVLGLREAVMGIAAAERHAQALEADRGVRVTAWRLRQLLQLALGNAEEARTCMRRAELLQLREGLAERHTGTNVEFDLASYFQSGDLLGVQSTVDVLIDLSAQHPGWRPVLLLAQSRYRQLQGDLRGALALLLPAFELAPPGRHPLYRQLAAAHVGLLVELADAGAALARGQRYLEICERERLTTYDHGLELALAQAWAKVGEHERAVALCDAVLASAQARGQAGLALGFLYEVRARIAIWMEEREAFERFAQLCAGEYAKGKNPLLSARFARLMQEASQDTLATIASATDVTELIAASQIGSEFATINSRMLECVDESERARCALTLLLQSSERFCGYLYGVQERRVGLIAGLPVTAPEEALDAWVNAYLWGELDSGADAIATDQRAAAESDLLEVPNRFADHEGRQFEAVLLKATRNQTLWVAAVLVLQVTPGPRTLPDKSLTEQLSHQLLDHGDVLGAQL